MRMVVAILAITCGLAVPIKAQNTDVPDTNRLRAVATVALPPAKVPYRLERLGGDYRAPWSMAFLPDGRILLVEKRGGLNLVNPVTGASDPMVGGPDNVLRSADSGLLDVALDPDFEANQRIFLAFAEGSREENQLAIWRARLVDDRLVGGEVIFRLGETKAEPSHPGGRLLFLPDKTLLATVGDGYDYKEKAQDPGSLLGKVIRLDRDGKVPADNPFIGVEGYAPEIWTMGHRNIQGLAIDRKTGNVWASEHGPWGGDEINLLAAGKNYGWPMATFGVDYDGKLISERLHIDGMQRPELVWSPSIGASGLAFYRGSRFPELDGTMLAGGLTSRSVMWLSFARQSGLWVERARYFGEFGWRIRDIREAPDGRIYILTDDNEQGQLLRLMPG